MTGRLGLAVIRRESLTNKAVQTGSVGLILGFKRLLFCADKARVNYHLYQATYIAEIEKRIFAIREVLNVGNISTLRR
jgi:hypothetical protein